MSAIAALAEPDWSTLRVPSWPMWARIKEQYERVSKPLALCFLLLVGVGGVVDNRSLQLAASIALLSLSLILQLLFEIHARVTTSDGARFFESFASAVPQMTSSIERRLHRGQSVRLRWVGVTHEAGWPAVQAVTKLVVDETVPRSASLRAELFIIDPDGDVCARTDGPNVAQIRATIGTIAHFVSDHDASLATHKSSIDVYKYDHRPTWHGLLIDEDILYWSVCMPSNLKLSAPQGGAEVVRASDGIASRHRIEHFISWTDELTRAASLPTLRVIAGGNDPMPARMAPAADLTIVPDAALPDDAISSSVAPAADLTIVLDGSLPGSETEV